MASDNSKTTKGEKDFIFKYRLVNENILERMTLKAVMRKVSSF